MEFSDDDGPLRQRVDSLRVSQLGRCAKRVVWCEKPWVVEPLDLDAVIVGGGALPSDDVITFVTQTMKPEVVVVLFDRDPRGVIIADEILRRLGRRLPRIRAVDWTIARSLVDVSVLHRGADFQVDTDRDPLWLSLGPGEVNLAKHALSSGTDIDRRARSVLEKLARQGKKHELEGLMNTSVHDAEYVGLLQDLLTSEPRA